ncbi:hypothetical protein ACPOL_6217 [Acidisarcina polymorpha]|uniref:Uncharacterized protein n=1 Tax=Acidisarcina polymorpha TaxID=2211140 RepID=A0A2Z5G8P7_9BACT|nr:hypothetical protein ACPOL_6217 [Acidisarcina polymorpha]
MSEWNFLAALCPLQTLPLGAEIELYSDSEPLIRDMRFQVHHWVRQEWKNRKGGALWGIGYIGKNCSLRTGV